jgi:hypothetical protein
MQLAQSFQFANEFVSRHQLIIGLKRPNSQFDFRNFETFQSEEALIKPGHFSYSLRDFNADGAAWTINAISNVNADATSDLLLKNTATGQFYVWDITNGAVSGTAGLGVVGVDWQLV